jgi:hypothetical protein
MRRLHLDFLENLIDGLLRQATAQDTVPSENRLTFSEDDHCWDNADPKPFPQRIFIVTNVNFSPSDIFAVQRFAKFRIETSAKRTPFGVKKHGNSIRTF